MINIPMRTKPSIDAGSFVLEAGRPSVQPAISFDMLKEMQKGRTDRQAQNKRTMQKAVQHYEVKTKGGMVLQKGGKCSLSRMASGNLKTIDVCLGWDVGENRTYDLDSSCFMLGENGKVIGDEWFVFYNQPESPDKAVLHNGDSKTDTESGGGERITVDLNRLSPRVRKLAFVLTINEAIEHGYSFKEVANAHARVIDRAGRKELALFNLSDYYDGVTAMTVCEIYLHNGEWKINPVGNGLKRTGLLELCSFYGVNVAD